MVSNFYPIKWAASIFFNSIKVDIQFFKILIKIEFKITGGDGFAFSYSGAGK